MKLTTQRMLGWRTSCLRGLVVILGLMAAAAVASAQESKPADESGTTTKPRDTSKEPNLDAPAKRVADPKMPDISGSWEMGKPFEFGEAVIRRIDDDSDDFAIQYRAAKDLRDQRIKWFPEAQRFEVTNIDPKPNRSARITLQLLATGKSMRVVYEVDEQTKQELRENPNLNEQQMNAFLNQEWTRTKKPEGKAAKSANASADSAKPAPANSDAVADAKMPDISGTWRVSFEGLNFKTTPIQEMEIRKVQNGATDFLIDQPWVETAKRVSVRWSAARKRFEGTWEVDENDSGITLQPLEGGETMRVVISNKLPPTKETQPDGTVKTLQSETFSTQEWTRTSLMLSTTFPAKHDGLSETANTSTRDSRPTDRTTNLHALPDTPAAKRLVEQLGTQESAAAAEAATIRQLQANGQAESNQQPIAEHQRKLKNLLSTAFDLKLQWEELQVKELQSRLSRLERQIGQRKELREKIINRRAGELIEGDALKWNSTPPAATKLADEAAGATSKTDPILSPDTLREQLEPFAKRATAAEARVRELEPVYFRDHSNTAELQQAFDEMIQLRRDWRVQWKAVELLIPALSADTTSAGVIADALERRLEPLMKQVSEGTATELELKTVNDSIKRAYETRASAKAIYDRNLTALRKVAPDGADEDSESKPYSAAPTPPQPGDHPDVALAWLEAATDLKLEFVRFDDLKLPFKAALRIRESSGGYAAGTLIVALYGQRFDSLDQAVVALKPSTKSHDPSVIHRTNTLLLGGLAGRPQQLAISYKSWRIDYLKPGFGYEADIRFEVRVRADGTDKVETQYITGICVSPDGLVVIPMSSASLVEGEPIVAFEDIKGTARVVGSDQQHELMLLKLGAPTQPLFSWLKCRMGKPTTNQRLRLYNDQSTNAVDSAAPVVVGEVGFSYPKPLEGDDAFNVLTGSIAQLPDGEVVQLLKSGFAPLPKRGDRLMSVENELQGLILSSTTEPTEVASKKEKRQRAVSIPAVHIQKLIDEYRRTASQQPPDPQALSQPPKTTLR